VQTISDLLERLVASLLASSTSFQTCQQLGTSSANTSRWLKLWDFYECNLKKNLWKSHKSNCISAVPSWILWIWSHLQLYWIRQETSTISISHLHDNTIISLPSVLAPNKHIIPKTTKVTPWILLYIILEPFLHAYIWTSVYMNVYFLSAKRFILYKQNKASTLRFCLLKIQLSNSPRINTFCSGIAAIIQSQKFSQGESQRFLAKPVWYLQ
jgi:hypothetical protein